MWEILAGHLLKDPAWLILPSHQNIFVDHQKGNHDAIGKRKKQL